jgi:hypothetical protein
MEYADGQVNAVISDVRCSWTPERLGDVVVIGRVTNPSSTEAVLSSPRALLNTSGSTSKQAPAPMEAA